MEKYYKGILFLISSIMILIVLAVIYMLYDANKTSNIKQINTKLDSLNLYKNKENTEKKISKWKRDFILKVLIRGLPQVIKNNNQCIDKLRKELDSRGLAISNLQQDDKRTTNVIHVLDLHVLLFNMKSRDTNKEMSFIFFPYDKNKKQFHTANYKDEIPSELFFKSMNLYIESTRCLPQEYIKIIDDNIEYHAAMLENTNYQLPLQNLGNINTPINFYQGFVKHILQNLKSFKMNQMNQMKETLFSLREIEDYLYRGITESNYSDFINLVNKTQKQLVVLSRKKEKIEKPKNSINEDKKNVTQSFKMLYKKIKESSQEEKEKFFSGVKTLYTTIPMNAEEITNDLISLDTNSLEYKIKGVSLMFKHLAHFLKDSIYEHLQFSKNDTEKEVVSKVSYLINNFDQFIKKEHLKKENSKKITREEDTQLQDYLLKLGSP